MDKVRPEAVAVNIDTHDQLRCPRCDDPWLHHGDIRVYGRDKEDGPSTVTEVCSGGGVHIHRAPLGVDDVNPSERRDAITIRFWCEVCYYYSRLEIVQHKGNTHLRMILEDEMNGPDEGPLS